VTASRILARCLAAALLATGGARAEPLFESTSPTADKTHAESIEHDPQRRRLPTLEIAVASVGLNGTWHFAGPLHLGAGGGAGPTLYRWSRIEGRDSGVDPTLEVVFVNAFVLLAPAEFLDLDAGGRVAVAGALSDVEGAPRGALVYGAYGDLRIGSRKLKLGPRFEYVAYRYGDFTEYGFRVTPVLLRLTI
jgi:hypothetical protein